MRSFASCAVFLCLAACSFDSKLEAQADVRCTSSSDCPEAFRCHPHLRRCLPVSGPGNEAPRIHSSRVSRTLVRSGEDVDFTIEVTEPLAEIPAFRLVQTGRVVTPALVGVVEGERPTYTFRHRFRAGVDAEGTSQALVDLVDRTGVEAIAQPAGQVEADFTAPRLASASFVAPRTLVADGGATALLDVRPTDAVVLRLTFSEPLQPGTRVLAAASGCGPAVAFQLVSLTEGVLDVAAQTPGAAGCTYAVTFEGASDVAGNVLGSSATSAGLSYRIDADAAAIEGLEILREEDGGLTRSAVFSRQAPFDVVTYRFRVGPTVQSVLPRLDGAPVAGCTLDRCTQTDGGFRSCLCARPVVSADTEGPHELSLSVSNAAGSGGSASAPLVFDFSAPRLLASTVQLSLEAPPRCPLPAVGALGTGATARLSFSVDEPGTSWVTTAPSNLGFTLERRAPSAFTFTAQLLAGQTYAQGVHTLDVHVSDGLGNLATHRLSTAPTVDTTPPPAPVLSGDGGLVYVRAPWGERAGPSRFDVVGPPGSVDPLSTLRVYDRPELGTAAEVGRAVASATGAVQAPLIRADRPVVYVTVTDQACNELAPVDVKRVEWRATLGQRSTGAVVDNPHRYEVRQDFQRQPEDADRQEPPAGPLANADGDAGVVRGGASWAKPRPDARYLAQAAYAPTRQRVVLFGGSSSANTQLDETWEWDGARWTQWLGVAPPPRASHAMAFDRGRGRLVVFGGLSRGVTFSDTWEWDGTLWTQRADAGPPGRIDAAMAYDVQRQRTVLFGGRAVNRGVPSTETWEWNGTVWARVSTTGPVTVGSPVLAYDEGRQAVTLVTCEDPGTGTAVGVTFDWNGSAWQRASGTPPPARGRGVLAYDSRRGRMVFFGGEPQINGDNDHPGDVWERLPGGWVQALPQLPSPAGPPRGTWQAGAFDQARGVFVVTHGRSSSETWTYDGGSWALGASGGPGGNTEQLVYDGARRVSLGLTPDNLAAPPRMRTWAWDGGSWTQQALGPSARTGYAIAYDAARREVIVFGGNRQGFVDPGRLDPPYLSDTWRWNGATWSAVNVAGPAPRYGAAMSFDPTRQTLTLTGGFAEDGGMHGDTWDWSGSAWTQRTVSGAPPPRGNHSFTFGPTGAGLLFAGEGYGGELSDTWELQGTSWRALAEPGPPQRLLGRLTPGPLAGTLVLLGGYREAGGSQTDHWEYGAQGWVQRRFLVPIARHGFGMAYDPDRRRIVVQGGTTTQRFGNLTAINSLSDTWEYGLQVGSRPAQVVRFDVLAAAMGAGASVRDVESRWILGGTGQLAGTPTPGAALTLLDGLSFVDVASTPAPASTPQEVVWRTADAALINRLLGSGDGKLSLAATSAGANASLSEAIVSVDYVELVLRYVRP